MVIPGVCGVLALVVSERPYSLQPVRSGVERFTLSRRMRSFVLLVLRIGI